MAKTVKKNHHQCDTILNAYSVFTKKHCYLYTDKDVLEHCEWFDIRMVQTANMSLYMSPRQVA